MAKTEHLARVPAELLLLVAESPILSTQDLIGLALTNSRYTNLVLSALYKKNIKEEHASAFLWAVLEESTNTMAMLVRYGADINSVEASAHLDKLQHYQWIRRLRSWDSHEAHNCSRQSGTSLYGGVLTNTIPYTAFHTLHMGVFPPTFTALAPAPANPAPPGHPAVHWSMGLAALPVPLGGPQQPFYPSGRQWRQRPTRRQFIFSPLALATRQGRTKVVKWLLTFGADPDVPAQDLCRCDNEPHMSSAIWRVPHQASRPLTHQPHWTALHLAIEYDHDDIFELLVAHGANASQVCRPEDGPCSALHTAFIHMRMSLAESLLYRFSGTDMVDINARGRGGITPLHIAYDLQSRNTTSKLNALKVSKSHQASLVDLALQFGAYINLEFEVDRNKWTLFSMACAQDDWSFALRLLKFGSNADFDLQTELGGRWTTQDFRSSMTGAAGAALALEIDRLDRDHEIAKLEL